jgi:hypothetical protein
MSQRAFYVFGSLVLTTLIAAPAAHAVCRSPKNICKHIDDCLQRPDNEDAERIKEGVRTRNGKMVWAGAEACAPDLGRKRQWDNWAHECSDLEYVSIAKVEMEIGKALLRPVFTIMPHRTLCLECDPNSGQTGN